MSNVIVFVKSQVVMIVSVPSLMKENRASRLTKNASFTAVLT